MTALIAFERAPIGAEPHWLDAGHHHSGSAILAPVFLSMIFSGLGINWGWGMGSSCFRRERYRALSHRRLA